MIFLEAVSRVPEERRTLFRTLYNTELCTHFLSDETSALPTERPLKTKKKKTWPTFVPLTGVFFRSDADFIQNLKLRCGLVY